VILVSGAASAAGAAPASLTATVTPTQLHPGLRYTVTIAGRYERRLRHSPPYLLAFIQYTDRPCRASAAAEYALPGSEWDWDYRQRAQTRSPFKAVTRWTAGPRLGLRRVCAYLYAGMISPRSRTRPLTRASVSFSNTKAPAKGRR
jgi:hypothetical protein